MGGQRKAWCACRHPLRCVGALGASDLAREKPAAEQSGAFGDRVIDQCLKNAQTGEKAESVKWRDSKKRSSLREEKGSGSAWKAEVQWKDSLSTWYRNSWPGPIVTAPQSTAGSPSDGPVLSREATCDHDAVRAVS